MTRFRAVWNSQASGSSGTSRRRRQAVTKTSENAGTVQVAGDAYATTADTVTVATGRQGDGRIEITSGLREGQLVVLADRRLPVPGGLGADMGRGSSASPTPTPSR